MLKIIFGAVTGDKYIFDPDCYFNNTYEDGWITESISAEMILDIDGSKVIGANTIDSPYLGTISPERLSGSVKTLILMEHDNKHIFNASACGDDCASWILKIAEDKDILIRLGYIMDFGKNPFEIKIENTGKIVHSMIEIDDEIIANDLLDGEKITSIE